MQLLKTEAGIWLGGGEWPLLVTDLYISYSAAELSSFVTTCPHLLPRSPEQAAFAALGLLPSRQQIAALKARYPHARWHLLFDNDLTGKITDARVAAWYGGRDALFRVNDDIVTAAYRGKSFAFDAAQFSFYRFERATGLRTGIRTYKAKGFTSYLKY